MAWWPIGRTILIHPSFFRADGEEKAGKLLLWLKLTLAFMVPFPSTHFTAESLLTCRLAIVRVFFPVVFPRDSFSSLPWEWAMGWNYIKMQLGGKQQLVGYGKVSQGKCQMLRCLYFYNVIWCSFKKILWGRNSSPEKVYDSEQRLSLTILG